MTLPSTLRTLCLPALLWLVAPPCTGRAEDAAASVYRAGYACLASNRLDEAARQFQSAAASTNAETAAAAWFGRGEALYRARRWNDAIAAYDALLKNFPAHRLAPDALCARGFAEQQSGQLAQAQATFNAFAGRHPKHALAPSCAAAAAKIARLLEAQSRRQAAEALAREVGAINAHVREGRHAEAAEAARRFLQAHPGSPQAAEVRYLIAAGDFQAKEYGRAAEAYREFLARHPAHAQAEAARLELGGALRALGRYGEAADAYASAAHRPQTALLRAECLALAGHHDEACQQYRAAARDADDPALKARATLALGDSCAALRKWDEAERAYLDVELLQGCDALRPAALGRLAEMYDAMGQPEKARVTRAELRRRYPDR